MVNITRSYTWTTKVTQKLTPQSFTQPSLHFCTPQLRIQLQRVSRLSYGVGSVVDSTCFGDAQDWNRTWRVPAIGASTQLTSVDSADLPLFVQSRIVYSHFSNTKLYKLHTDNVPTVPVNINLIKHELLSQLYSQLISLSLYLTKPFTIFCQLIYGLFIIFLRTCNWKTPAPIHPNVHKAEN
jgi:hypothetical protein